MTVSRFHVVANVYGLFRPRLQVPQLLEDLLATRENETLRHCFDSMFQCKRKCPKYRVVPFGIVSQPVSQSKGSTTMRLTSCVVDAGLASFAGVVAAAPLELIFFVVDVVVVVVVDRCFRYVTASIDGVFMHKTGV